jgi:DNA-binding CsgD family transcriptional regulator
VVIEPATAAEIASILLEASALTPREREVTRLLARGLATADVADALTLSHHTVRDHIKSVFEKVGVSSRAELVATLSTNHPSPAPLDAIAA